MAWNVPGGSGDKDPWGQRRKGEKGPPDLDEIVRNIQRKLSGLFGGRGGGDGGPEFNRGGRFGAGLIVLVAVGLWLLTGCYIVNQGERGVVLRFGKKSQITDAGLRWHWPYPIESVEKVNVENIHQFTIGFRDNARSSARTKVPKEALMLTKDENIIDIEFAVQYKIDDPAAYLFNLRDVEPTISQATESAVREIVGNNTLDFAMTEGRDQVGRNARDLLQEILDRYHCGVHIVRVETQKAQPPDEVKAAFDDAVKAREDEQRLKNEAEAYANDVIPRARGAAARLLQEAQGYKARVVARAEGDAQRFVLIANEYAKAPAVTRERLYLETMEEVLSNSTKIFVDQKNGHQILYLPLDKLAPPAEAAGEPAKPRAMPEPPAPAAPTDGGNRNRSDLRQRGTE